LYPTHKYRRNAKFAAWYDDFEDEETGLPFKNPFRKYRATSRGRREEENRATPRTLREQEYRATPRARGEEDFSDILRPQSQSDVDLPRTDPSAQAGLLRSRTPLPTVKRGATVADKATGAPEFSPEEKKLLDWSPEENSPGLSPSPSKKSYAERSALLAGFARTTNRLRQALWPKQDHSSKAEQALIAANEAYRRRDVHSKILVASLLLDDIESETATVHVETMDHLQINDLISVSLDECCRRCFNADAERQFHDQASELCMKFRLPRAINILNCLLTSLVQIFSRPSKGGQHFHR
jgi:hypothetical protein